MAPDKIDARAGTKRLETLDMRPGLSWRHLARIDFYDLARPKVGKRQSFFDRRI